MNFFIDSGLNYPYRKIEMKIDDHEVSVHAEESATVGQKILDSLSTYDMAFSKLTLTQCLATLLKNTPSDVTKVLDLNRINHLLHKIGGIPTIH